MVAAAETLAESPQCRRPLEAATRRTGGTRPGTRCPVQDAGGWAVIQAAAKASGTTVNAIKRHAGPALERTESGRIRAKKSDRLVRSLHFPTETGMIGLDVKDSRSAKQIAAYWNAVRKYVETGDSSGLRKFRGKHVRVNKRAYVFITDSATLDRLADAGELAFDDLYDLMEAA